MSKRQMSKTQKAAFAEYLKVKDRARSEHEERIARSLAEYHKVLDQAWDEFEYLRDQAQDEYQKKLKEEQ